MDAKDISLGKKKINGQYLNIEDEYSRQQKFELPTCTDTNSVGQHETYLVFPKKTGVANIHNFLGDNKQYDIHLCLRLKQNETENPHGIELNSRISLILFLLAKMIRIWL